ncbi:ABC transporter substrate-binding protein [Streptomyces albus]|uniref:ABC transporter substrate-binding protein n=1 Tax=Streptomyces albus TaxID=1888 RepID=UPI0033C7741B
MSTNQPWTFRDDRGQKVAAPRPPRRLVAYTQAAAVLHEHGVATTAVFGSPHDEHGPGETAPALADVPGVPYLGAGKALTAAALTRAEPELLVSVTYDGERVYGIDSALAAELPTTVPLLALGVGPGTSLTAVRDRFAELARALGAAPATTADPGSAALARGLERLRAAARAKPRPRVLACSPAGPDRAHLARPQGWPLLRELAGAGVDLLDLPSAPGPSWGTADWEELAALEPDIVLRDVRPSATPDAELAAVPGWRRIGDRATMLPWDPELPFTARALGVFLDTVTDAVTRHAAR